jgi:hypothetical protein
MRAFFVSDSLFYLKFILKLAKQVYVSDHVGRGLRRCFREAQPPAIGGQARSGDSTSAGMNIGP